MSKLKLEQANAIIENAFVKAAEMKIKPLGVVVLDDGGNVVSAQRQDGASMFRLDVARGKAWASVAMGSLEPGTLHACEGQPQLLRHLGGDRRRQVPAADRRRTDQERARRNSRRCRRQRWLRRGGRGVLRLWRREDGVERGRLAMKRDVIGRDSATDNLFPGRVEGWRSRGR